MNYKMIVLDLDGTLTNREKKITPRTKKALMEAQKRGKIVVLASGRPAQGILHLAEELEMEQYGGYILAFNGGMIINCRTGEAVSSILLPQDVNHTIVKLAEEHRVNILTYEGNTIITRKKEDPYVELEAGINQMTIREIDDLADYVRGITVPKFLMIDDGDYLATVEPLVQSVQVTVFCL